MTSLVQTFVDVIGILWTFIEAHLIPTTVSGVNIIHVAIWTPVTIGLASMTIAFAKGMWKR